MTAVLKELEVGRSSGTMGTRKRGVDGVILA
jgi:hypothetical protein